jgi:hypothetical protein
VKESKDKYATPIINILVRYLEQSPFEKVIDPQLVKNYTPLVEHGVLLPYSQEHFEACTFTV